MPSHMPELAAPVSKLKPSTLEADISWTVSHSLEILPTPDSEHGQGIDKVRAGK
jgi:hypothetical protein